LTFLYIQYDEYDSAALTMIKHPVDAWDHGLFKDVIVKVANLEICYKAIEFYLESEPLRTSELLSVLVSRVDHTRVVNLVRKLGHLAVIKQYLLAVQEANILAVNTALNELYIEEEDYTHLRKSIDTYSNIDPLALARSLETHDLVEFRRIAAYLYKVRHATPRHATPRHATPRHATPRHATPLDATRVQHALTHSLTHSLTPLPRTYSKTAAPSNRSNSRRATRSGRTPSTRRPAPRSPSSARTCCASSCRRAARTASPRRSTHATTS